LPQNIASLEIATTDFKLALKLEAILQKYSTAINIDKNLIKKLDYSILHDSILQLKNVIHLFVYKSKGASLQHAFK